MINCLTLDKNMLSVENVRREVCPDLNLHQIRQICELYQCGEFEDPIPGTYSSTLFPESLFVIVSPSSSPFCRGGGGGDRGGPRL